MLCSHPEHTGLTMCIKPENWATTGRAVKFSEQGSDNLKETKQTTIYTFHPNTQ
jgi:hypothetical protein